MIEKADTPSKKGCKRAQSIQEEVPKGVQGYNESQDPREGGRTNHPRRGTKGAKKGHNGIQDPRAGGHAIQERVQRESRNDTIGVNTLGGADAPSKKHKGSKKGYNGSPDPWEGGHTIQDGVQS